MKKVLFISNLKNPQSSIISSTDIMNINLIDGLSKLNIELTLLVLYDKDNDKESLLDYYSKYKCNILFLKRFFHEGQSPLFAVFGSLFAQYLKGLYNKRLKESDILRKYYDLIISNKVTIDEIIIGKLLKRHTHSRELIQYWSDPMALSGINIDIYRKSKKRKVFRIIERKAISGCDGIVYGTRTLYETQSEFFPQYKGKMSYIDIGYCDIKNTNEINNNRFIYAGNYFSRIRNIEPLIKAFENQDKYALDIYGDGNYTEKNKKMVNFYDRIHKEELDNISSNYHYQICLLNKDSTQIPGKLFYDMMSNRQIIVLVDGPKQKSIIDYLKEYKRFIIVNNNIESISRLLSKINDIEIDYEYIKHNYNNTTIADSLISKGRR